MRQPSGHFPDYPLVSIILPTYNGARYLAEAIESCLAQTYRNWELIIVDDSSTDQTPEIIQAYTSADYRIRSIRHEHNRKLPAALNSGFDLAQGQLLTWTSDDNRYRPTALAMMTSFLSEHADVDVVYANTTLIDDQGKTIGRFIAGNPEDLPHTNSVGACFLYRRTLLEGLEGYDDNFFMAEDHEFWLRAMGEFRFQPMNEDLYLYRIHGNSLRESEQRGTKLASRKVLEKYLAERRLPRWTTALAYLKLASDASILNERGAAATYFLKALRTSPSIAFRRQATKVVIYLFGGLRGFMWARQAYTVWKRLTRRANGCGKPGRGGE